MDNYIPISTLNDFIFCPYSIYLHNVYMDTDEGLYHATPQTKGRIVHETIDTKKASNRADDLLSLPIMSEEFGVMGKIDIYFFDAIIVYKNEIFKYVQAYYRCFMGGKDIENTEVW